MTIQQFGISDFESIAAGAAILGGGGGGSYCDALSIIQQLAGRWNGTVTVQDYDGKSGCGVIAMMGSPDAATSLSLDDVSNTIANTLRTYGNSSQGKYPLSCFVPGETGPINSLVPLFAAALQGGGLWVVDGDGAGRAVPELPQTTFAGNKMLCATPALLANDVSVSAGIQSAVLSAPDSAALEKLAGGIVSAFGSFSGIMLWLSNAGNNFSLGGSYIPGTLSQAWQLGGFLRTASAPPATAVVARQIMAIAGRTAMPVVTNFYITGISQSTNSQSLDAGVIRLDNDVDPARSTETHYIYNLNENLIMYSSKSGIPDIVAPDAICYYSESTGRGFSNASNDLAVYFDTDSGKSTGKAVSVIKVAAAQQLYDTKGVIASFAGLLRSIGYAGVMPYPEI